MKKTETKSIAKNRNTGLRRRDFFKILGGGIIVFFSPWDALELMEMPAEQARSLPKDFNAFVHIAEDGTVTCYTGKIEMGQGIITSLPVMAADELDVPLEKVKLVLGDTALCPFDQGTYGSLTTRSFGPAMRAALAEAKGVLMELASEKLKVPASQLVAEKGVIYVSGNKAKRVTYGELTRGKRIEKFLEVKPPVKDYTKFIYVGKSYKKVDSVEKVKGEAKFTGDLKLPGMLFARILRPPSHGATLKSADTSAAEKIEGVKVVRDDGLIAVVSENKDKVDEAIVKIKAEYEFNELPVNDRNLFEWILKAQTSSSVSNTAGDIELGRKQSEHVFETEFHDVYLAHAPIETHTALAQFEGEKLTVWASTQQPFPLQDSLANELKMPRDNVRVIVPYVGGAFGAKNAYQQAIEAARLAKLTGKPVMVVWTREEEFFYDTFHSSAVVKVNSGIDREGRITFWDYHVWMAGTRGAETVYDVPNRKTTSYSRARNAPPVHPFATGPWRAPNNNTNTFARECQIDIMAAKAGMDPLEFRLKNLKDQKMIDCLKAVADKFGYTPSKFPSGRGIGIACGIDAGTWQATMAEIKVDRTTGKITVLRLACAQDMGLCVNPQGALLQMEGCLTMGLGYALTEEVLFEGGNIKTLNFDTYEIPRFSWVPKLECVILDRKDQPPQGGGEPAIIAVGAAIANALFDATGARIYRVPLTPTRVLEALKKA
ncbi:MAG TPA: molybdopterin-dependent oxidoreductase [Bacteroidales bacterium]|nr:molybdopterin-dependent oxidoreductase [Bacteroidales bacterium]